MNKKTKILFDETAKEFKDVMEYIIDDFCVNEDVVGLKKLVNVLRSEFIEALKKRKQKGQ